MVQRRRRDEAVRRAGILAVAEAGRRWRCGRVAQEAPGQELQPSIADATAVRRMYDQDLEAGAAAVCKGEGKAELVQPVVADRVTWVNLEALQPDQLPTLKHVTKPTELGVVPPVRIQVRRTGPHEAAAAARRRLAAPPHPPSRFTERQCSHGPPRAARPTAQLGQDTVAAADGRGAIPAQLAQGTVAAADGRGAIPAQLSQGTVAAADGRGALPAQLGQGTVAAADG